MSRIFISRIFSVPKLCSESIYSAHHSSCWSKPLPLRRDARFLRQIISNKWQRQQQQQQQHSVYEGAPATHHGRALITSTCTAGDAGRPVMDRSNLAALLLCGSVIDSVTID